MPRKSPFDPSNPERIEELPVYRDSARALPEGGISLFVLRFFIVITLLVTVGYTVFRVGFTLPYGVWWLAVPLIVVEVLSGITAVGSSAVLWDISAGPDWYPVESTDLRIAVLIPTLNETEDVLLPTIAAAMALQPAHETWVLDDGRRPWVEQMTAELGARYLTREDNLHAKAGNLNNGYRNIDADVFAIFDADHVPGPDFLRNTLCYLDDPKVAIVQTAQDFYNLNSFEHLGMGKSILYEELLYFRVMGPAQNFWHASSWVGTCALVRVEAIRSIGGFPTESITEDALTTMRLTKIGWRIVGHNEVLARGLAPASYTAFAVQRNRWTAGSMQVLRLENPLLISGLTPRQRYAFSLNIPMILSSWRALFLFIFPALLLLSGQLPIDDRFHNVAYVLAAVYPLQLVTMWLTMRGLYHPFMMPLFDLSRLPAIVPATFVYLFPNRPRTFRVTPKGVGAEERSPAIPNLHWLMFVTLGAALVWYVLTVNDLTPMHYKDSAIFEGIAYFVLANFLFLTYVMLRIKWVGAGKDAEFNARISAHLDGTPCLITGLTARTADVALAPGAPAVGQHRLSFSIEGRPIALDCEVATHRAAKGEDQVTLRFLPDQRPALAAMLLGLLNSTTAYPATARSNAELAPVT